MHNAFARSPRPPPNEPRSTATSPSRIADDPATSRLLLHAPEQQQLPVLLFACVHWLLLNEPDQPLARYYPNLTADVDTTDRRIRRSASSAPRTKQRLAGLLGTRSTQTNEVGRCATILPLLGLVADEVGPLALVDVGSSGGLTLLFDRYECRYEPGGTVGGPSPVVLECGTRGDVPVPERYPVVGARIGLDRSPIDLTDPDASRWLEACVWPDQADRFHRLRSRDRPRADRPAHACAPVTPSTTSPRRSLSSPVTVIRSS